MNAGVRSVEDLVRSWERAMTAHGGEVGVIAWQNVDNVSVISISEAVYRLFIG